MITWLVPCDVSGGGGQGESSCEVAGTGHKVWITYMCKGAGAPMCVRVFGPEDDARCLPQPLLRVFCETVSLTLELTYPFN